MKNQSLLGLMNWLQPKQETVLLCDSIAAASDMAFMLNGDWDGCNSLVIPKSDKVAIEAAASLVETSWCYQNACETILIRLGVDEFLRRYAVGERFFINANLRCAQLREVCLENIDLSYAKLNIADLGSTNLSKANLTAAQLPGANLSGSNLSGAQLVRANLAGANLSDADLRGADLSWADLSNTNFKNADLRGANLGRADLRKTSLNEAIVE
ncbi:MAG: pentapeptide repeat-containing protein [Oscillatoriales cyanobacterium]|uniref:pentapeptide repeat-containing protein n=1 Tax=unclassified Microcoleus TaxID=2642155 RepID=UPI001D9522B3|nr:MULTISPECIES: pentapeptide repeat-containing protein [unclassified Microcoleus]TAE82786.1 MAG: pentapeptide repeat-containing protein [Oscillatoriales cyanobacterium]TAE96221.1 MAG: pentapeptide repeat-containing protein [Oscillatoriales cyanobacterium]TAF20312.1 MAG: pentapeptide repeat-containing protein [Oscillatoriales cyanobacterium]TAF39007.1 MAG: pentapeptide repeat-containing protein [Oscillatoriales cyanobacterium]